MSDSAEGQQPSSPGETAEREDEPEPCPGFDDKRLLVTNRRTRTRPSTSTPGWTTCLSLVPVTPAPLVRRALSPVASWDSFAASAASWTPILWIAFGLLLAFVGGLLGSALQQFSPARILIYLEKQLSQDPDKLADLPALEEELDRAERFVAPASLLQYLGIGLAIYGSTLVDSETILWLQGLPGLLLTLVCAALFGAILPHKISIWRAEETVYKALPLLRFLHRIFLPLTWPLNQVTRFFVRNLMGIRREEEEEKEQENLADEIRAAVEDSDEGEALHEEEKDWIENIVDFQKADVAHVMTPRTEIVAISSDKTFREAVELALAEGHSRMPIFDKTLDDITGIFYVRDSVRLMLESATEVLDTPVGDHVRQPYFVPESKAAGELLREFKDKRLHIAIVVDEYGGTAGLVSLEDIVEEIVGEIADEYDDEEEATVALKVIEPGRLAEVDGKVQIDDINEALGIEIPESEDYETVGGYVLAQLGKVPEVGENFSESDVRITVLAAGARKVDRLRIQVLDKQRSAG